MFKSNNEYTNHVKVSKEKLPRLINQIEEFHMI